MNNEFVKEFSQNVKNVESENNELKELLIEKVEKMKFMEEELFEYQNGRPLNKEETQVRDSEHINFAQGVRDGSIISSVRHSKAGSRKSSAELNDYGLPENTFD